MGTLDAPFAQFAPTALNNFSGTLGLVYNQFTVETPVCNGLSVTQEFYGF